MGCVCVCLCCITNPPLRHMVNTKVKHLTASVGVCYTVPTKKVINWKIGSRIFTLSESCSTSDDRHGLIDCFAENMCTRLESWGRSRILVEHSWMFTRWLGLSFFPKKRTRRFEAVNCVGRRFISGDTGPATEILQRLFEVNKFENWIVATNWQLLRRLLQGTKIDKRIVASNWWQKRFPSTSSWS